MDLLYPFCVYFVEPSFCTWEPSSQQAGLCLRDLPIVTLVVGMPFRGILEGIHPQPTKKIKVSCHPTIEVSYEKLTTSQCIPIFLPKFNSKLKPWNWLSKDDESGGVSNFGRGTLFGLEHQVYRTRIFKQTHHIYWQMYIGLWAMAPNQGVQNGTLTCAHNWCRIYRWSDPFFLEGGKAGVNSGSILVKQTKFSQGIYSWLQPPTCSNRSTTNWTHSWTQIGKMVVFHGRTSMASKWLTLFGKNFQSHQYTTKKLWK